MNHSTVVQESSEKVTYLDVWNKQSRAGKVGLVVGTVLFTPVVASCYVAKKTIPPAVKVINNSVVQPSLRKIEKVYYAVMQKISRLLEWLEKKVIDPLLPVIAKVVDWTNDKMIDPLSRLITFTMETIFLDAPKFLFDSVWPPIRECFRKIIVLTYEKILTPVGHFLAEVAVKIWEKVEEVYKKVIEPFATSLANQVAKFYEESLVPVGLAVAKVAKKVFVEFPKKLYRDILRPVVTSVRIFCDITFNKVLVPVAFQIKKISKNIFIILPKLIQKQVINPSLEMLETGRVWTRNYVIKPFEHSFDKFLLSNQIKINF